MAVIDNATGLDAGIFKTWGPQIVWWLFNQTKDRSYKGKWLGIPFSIKIAKLRGLVELWVGPEPTTI